jgi:hypothetical protein
MKLRTEKITYQKSETRELGDVLRLDEVRNYSKAQLIEAWANLMKIKDQKDFFKLIQTLMKLNYLQMMLSDLVI